MIFRSLKTSERKCQNVLFEHFDLTHPYRHGRSVLATSFLGFIPWIFKPWITTLAVPFEEGCCYMSVKIYPHKCAHGNQDSRRGLKQDTQIIWRSQKQPSDGLKYLYEDVWGLKTSCKLLLPPHTRFWDIFLIDGIQGLRSHLRRGLHWQLNIRPSQKQISWVPIWRLKITYHLDVASGGLFSDLLLNVEYHHCSVHPLPISPEKKSLSKLWLVEVVSLLPPPSTQPTWIICRSRKCFCAHCWTWIHTVSFFTRMLVIYREHICVTQPWCEVPISEKGLGDCTLKPSPMLCKCFDDIGSDGGRQHSTIDLGQCIHGMSVRSLIQPSMP